MLKKPLDNESVTFLCKLQREDARNELISRFKPECYKISYGTLKEFQNTGIEGYALANSCLSILVHTAYKFKYDGNNKFASYFRCAAKNEIMEILENESYKSNKSYFRFSDISLDDYISSTEESGTYSKIVGVSESEDVGAGLIISEIKRKIRDGSIPLKERNRNIAIDYLNNVDFETIREKYGLTTRSLQNCLKAIKEAIQRYFSKIKL